MRFLEIRAIEFDWTFGWSREIQAWKLCKCPTLWRKFLPSHQSKYILKGISYFDLEENIPEAGGSVGVTVTNFGRKLKSSISPKNKVKMEIELTGVGHVVENNTNLDLSQQKNLKLVQNKINMKTSEHVLEMVTKVQKQFGTDVFGFNQTLNRQHPSDWNNLKGQWDTIFPDIEVTVKVNVNSRTSMFWLSYFGSSVFLLNYPFIYS
jgi:spore germination protein KC